MVGKGGLDPGLRTSREFTLTGQAGPHRGQKWKLGKGRATIGRGRRQMVALQADPEVSTEHASIEYRDGRHYLRDHESTNGTHVNEVRIRKEHVLSRGDHLRVGTTSVLVYDSRAKGGGGNRSLQFAAGGSLLMCLLIILLAKAGGGSGESQAEARRASVPERVETLVRSYTRTYEALGFALAGDGALDTSGLLTADSGVGELSGALSRVSLLRGGGVDTESELPVRQDRLKRALAAGVMRCLDLEAMGRVPEARNAWRAVLHLLPSRLIDVRHRLALRPAPDEDEAWIAVSAANDEYEAAMSAIEDLVSRSVRTY